MATAALDDHAAFFGSPADGTPWWERRWTLALLVLVSAVPLLAPDIAPLVDLPGHLGRYHIQLELARSPALQRFYGFKWALIGNLGIDLLVIPLSKLFGLELAVKLVVLAIPPTTVAAFLLVAREAHGRLPPTALFVPPLAYGYPFMFGFVNFCLSMALAFLAFALWLRLGRLGRTQLRAALFVPIAVMVWIAHAFGWGTLGVLAFAAEAARQRGLGRSRAAAAMRGAVHAMALGTPFLLMLVWRTGAVEGGTGDWFNMETKLHYFMLLLRDRWQAFDQLSILILLLVVFAGWRGRWARPSNALVLGAGLLFPLYLLLPRILLGSAYADMRLAPYLLATAVLAAGLSPDVPLRRARLIAAAGLAFALVRMGATTWSLFDHSRGFERELAALDRLPRGARVAAFVGKSCNASYALARKDHLPSIATVRRDAFSNDQWALAGAQLLRVDHPAAGRFARDPSQLVTERPCAGEWLSLDQSLRRLPRDAFDHVWLIDPPRYDPRLTRGLRPIWRSGTSILFHVEQ